MPADAAPRWPPSRTIVAASHLIRAAPGTPGPRAARRGPARSRADCDQPRAQRRRAGARRAAARSSDGSRRRRRRGSRRAPGPWVEASTSPSTRAQYASWRRSSRACPAVHQRTHEGPARAESRGRRARADDVDRALRSTDDQTAEQQRGQARQWPPEPRLVQGDAEAPETESAQLRMALECTPGGLENQVVGHDCLTAAGRRLTTVKWISCAPSARLKTLTSSILPLKPRPGATAVVADQQVVSVRPSCTRWRSVPGVSGADLSCRRGRGARWSRRRCRRRCASCRPRCRCRRQGRYCT